MRTLLTIVITICAIATTCGQQLYLTERHRTDESVAIRSFPADPQTYIQSGTVPSSVLFQQPTGIWTKIASDYERGRIIWSDGALKFLWSGNVTETQATPLYRGTSDAIGGIAIDWMTGNVYWSDDNYNWIMVLDRNGNSKVLIDTALDTPGGVAVYPERGYLYWTNRGTRPKIERCDLAGENRQLVATANVRSPRGIAVDHTSERIYWTDSDDVVSTLESCDLNGNDRRTEFSLPSTEGIFRDVAVFQNYIYITDWTDVLRCILKEERVQYFSLGLRAQPFGITIYAPQKESSLSESPCTSNPCEHICVGNGYNDYKCLCRDGFNLHQDETSCIQEDTIAPPIVIVAFKTKICWYPGTLPDIATSKLEKNCFLTNQSFTASVTVDEEEKLLFVSDIQSKSISRMSLQNNATIDEIIGATGSVEGLAVDWLSQNLYWTDNRKGHIAVSRYDGRFFKVLIDEGVLSPRSIVVDPHQRVLFWTQYGPPAAINRANLDGSGQLAIVYDQVIYPSGLAADYAKKRLYFADDAYGAIQVVDYGGQNRDIVTLRRGHRFFDITIFKDYLMWTEWDTSNGVHILNKESQDPDSYRSHIMTNEDNIYGIASFSKHRQRNGNGPCGRYNGGCGQLCLPSGPLGSYHCNCSVGYKLQEDGRTCSSEPVKDNFLLLTDTYLHGIFQLDMTEQTPKLAALPLGHLIAPLGIGYDPVEEKVYWSDAQDNVVTRARLTGAQKEIIIGGQGEENTYRPHSLALEPSARLLYWTDIHQESVIVCRLDGTRKKTLISNIQYPRDIVISNDRAQNYIFWSSWGETAAIERAFMDGTGRDSVASDSLGWPNSLTVDPTENLLYWTDAKLHRLEVSDFLGLTRRTLTTLDEERHPFGIAFVSYDHNLYWSDWSRGILSRLEIQQRYSEEENGGVSDIEHVKFSRPNYIHAFSKASEASGNKACVVNNGGCTGLCFPSGFNQRCACADGVQLGSDLRTCSFDTEQGLCPDEISHGQLDEGCSLLPGSRCSYRCHKGYRAVYNNILCLSTGVWRQEQHEFCEEITCSAPPINAKTTEINCRPPFQVGTTCAVQCKTGYQVLDNDRQAIICDMNAHWSEDPMQCEEIRMVTEPATTIAPSLQPAISFDARPEDLTIEVGQTDIIQECIANDSNADVTWYKDGQQIISDTIEDVFIMSGGNNLFITEVRDHHAGKYTCRVQLQDIVIEASAYMTFQPDTIFEATPDSAVINAGEDHVLECKTNNPIHIVKWEKDGITITYSDAIRKVPMTDSLLIRNALESDSGHYACVVLTFDRTRIAEALAELTVNPLEGSNDICGTITNPRAVSYRAAQQETNQQARIVNGSISMRGAAPWMARLYSIPGRTHFCGGILLNREWIVTAGHCVNKFENTLENLLIRLGDFDDLETEDSEEVRGVSKIRLHHKFDYDNFDRDIALVKLSRPIDKFTDFIRPICLVNNSYGSDLIQPGVKGLVMGWGRVEEEGHYARYMKEVKLPIRGRNVCKRSTNYLFSKYMFCAGNPNVRGDSCDGDSGGPFAVLDGDRWHLVGLVSWGVGCAREGQYGFYTKVPRLYSWIQAQMNKH